jgi:hypothetical protein
MLLATMVLLLHLAAPDVPTDVTVEPTVVASVAPTNSPSDADDQASKVTAVSSSRSGSPKLTAVSLDATSENSQTLSTVRVPSIQPATPKKMIPVEEVPSRRNWLILSIVQHSAATFDAYSTRQAVSTGAVEADPFMRPFAQSPAIYLAIQAGPVALDYAARRMQRSPNNFLRHTWWVPQSVSTGLFLFSGFHNLSIANRP